MLTFFSRRFSCPLRLSARCSVFACVYMFPASFYHFPNLDCCSLLQIVSIELEHSAVIYSGAPLLNTCMHACIHSAVAHLYR